ncbi:MAG TPA: hypothetical protein VMH05_09175 [Bryobacteraceae bacterium]|nr:hypothetical protein [Bryobacteraceae bacterium]
MLYRLTGLAGFLAISLTLPALGQTTVRPAPESKRTGTKAAPRTSDGHPDLQGVWTNATITPLERPAELAGKATLTDAEAKVWEKKDLSSNTLDSDVDSGFNRVTGGPGVGAYNNLFVDRGSELARVDGVKRTSLIIDPPDGRIPPLTDAARERNTNMVRGFNRYDDVKERPLSERCIIGFGSTSGPPMLPVLYNNNYQIVQTPGYVMILVEMVHDIRVIRINGTHKPASVRQLLGDSIGHWEGDTLVVDTTNFTGQTRFRGSSENLHVIERFTRVDANTILYKATIDDPATYTKQWTLEYPFRATSGPVYEYACHEGNYAMTDIMSGARKLEKQEGKPR